MLTIPNGQTLATTKTLCLQLNNLPQQATTAYCVPNIHNNLLVVSELCNAGCEVAFDKNGMVVQSKGVIVLQRWRAAKLSVASAIYNFNRNLSPTISQSKSIHPRQ